MPAALDKEMEHIHGEGNSLIMVAVDDALGGAIEMCAANRPEAEEVIRGLRERGAKHLAIISGDHDRPTRKLAEKLGMDRYFAEVLPQDKAKYVELLQKEGRTVCFIGDGINDSIALKKANVSISLRGASTIATDTAQVVFMEESLAKILRLRDISQSLQKNIDRSWGLIIVPNALCVGGAFFAGFGVMHSMVFKPDRSGRGLGQRTSSPEESRRSAGGKKTARPSRNSSLASRGTCCERGVRRGAGGRSGRGLGQEEEKKGDDQVDGEKLRAFDPVAFSIAADQDHDGDGQGHRGNFRQGKLEGHGSAEEMGGEDEQGRDE